MLRLKLIRDDEQEVIYNYYPENKNEFGTISVNKNTGEVKIISEVEKDKFCIYRNHALSKIRECQRKGAFIRESIVAWC